MIETIAQKIKQESHYKFTVKPKTDADAEIMVWEWYLLNVSKTRTGDTESLGVCR